MKFEDYILPQTEKTKDDFTVTYYYYKGVLIKKRDRGHMHYLASYNCDENLLTQEVDFDEEAYQTYKNNLEERRAEIEANFCKDMVKKLDIKFKCGIDRITFFNVFEYMRRLTNEATLYTEHGVRVSYEIGSKLADMVR